MSKILQFLKKSYANILYYMMVGFFLSIFMHIISGGSRTVATIIIAGFSLLLFAGRNVSRARRKLEPMSRDAVVVMKCQYVTEANEANRQTLQFRIDEIWRDWSRGGGAGNAGDVVEYPMALNEYVRSAEGAVLFFRAGGDGRCALSFTAFIHDGKLCDVPVEKAKHVISSATP